MTVTKVNPDSVILSQMDEQYAKFLTLVLWKYHNDDKGVVITFDDIKRYEQDYNEGKAYLFTHGHHDSIEFKIVTKARAEVLAAYDQSKAGNA